MKTKINTRNKLIVAFILGLSFIAAIAIAITDETYQLSDLRIYNRVMLLVQERYVEKDMIYGEEARAEPKTIFRSALQEVEKLVPEIVVKDISSKELSVQVGKDYKTFNLDDITSLWSTSFALRDVAQFLEGKISPETDMQEVEYALANGALNRLDPHSVLLSPPSSQEMKVSTRGQFGGLGIVISLKDGYLTVISPMEDTPAFKEGIKPNDRIIKIDDDSTVNMALDIAVERLRGEPGSIVRLTIEREGISNPLVFKIKRAIIKVEAVTYKLIDKSVGYIKLKSFHGKASEDIAAARKAMTQEAGGKRLNIILDLRNNPGGLLDQAVAVSDQFLDGGVVVTTKGAFDEDREDEFAKKGNHKTDFGLVVLVNGGSASASEIVAGAIKNRERGLIVGEQTFGKGSVQMLYDFPDNSSLKLTVAHYLTPGNQSIQSIGITPDIMLHKATVDNLFFHEDMREENLEGHFNSSSAERGKPLLQAQYFAEKVDPMDAERKAISSKFVEDAEIKFAKNLLLKSTGPTRADLIKTAQEVIGRFNNEEDKKIVAALQKKGVDWSKPRVVTNPNIEFSLTSKATASPGGVLKLTFEALNVGKEPVHQLYALSESKTKLFDGKELIFGKVGINGKRQGSIEIKIPKDSLPRKDLMRLNLYRSDGTVVKKLDVPITINELKHSILAYSYYVDDQKHGKGMGVRKDNIVDVVVLIKNIGEATAEEPMVLLKNEGGKEVDIVGGRQKLSPLKPGQSAVARNSFLVRADEGAARFKLQVYDAAIGDAWQEKITIPIEKVDMNNETNGMGVIAHDKVALRASASSNAPVIAYLPHKMSVETLSTKGDFIQVKVDTNLMGFVEKSDISSTSKVAIVKIAPSIVYNRIPPKIAYQAALRGAIVASDKIRLDVNVSDDNHPKDIMIYVNDKKELYQECDKSGPLTIDVNTDIKLNPGVNVITTIVREDELYAQTSSIAVFSSAGDPIAFKNELKNRR